VKQLLISQAARANRAAFCLGGDESMHLKLANQGDPHLIRI